MNEEMLFQQVRFIRARTIAMLDATPNSIASEIPQGFKNNILWNFGHLYVSHELLLYSFLQEQHDVPQHYIDMFKMNTSPSDWTTEPPSLAELKEKLVDQPKRTIDKFIGRINEKGEKPFNLGPQYQFTTLGEIICFVNWHEGLHQGSINSLKRALGVEDLYTAVE